MSSGDISYFHSYKDYFWQWENDGEVIAIPNSGTIAYIELVLKILTALAPQGLPPFGTLILTLSYASVSKFGKHKKIEEYLNRSNVTESGSSDIDDAIRFLNILKSLGSEYHTGEKKILLLITIFKDSHNRFSVKKSGHILKAFQNKKREIGRLSQNISGLYNKMYKDIRPLALLLKKYPTAQSIKNAMAGIIDIEEIELEEIDTLEDHSNDLVSQIIRNEDTFKSGALIKRIWSSANIPMHSKVPSGQPFGGVADITNKGDFDKLLISEFANEDVAFLSRLANREAMYFNREAPPSDNKEDRILILDVSLKNWGIPKTIGYALMLAIAHHPNSKNNYICYAVGRRAYKLNIDDIDEIVESAQVLDTSLNAATGLNELFSENDFSQNEVFFISERSSSDVIDVSQVLSENNYPIDYWMYPDGKGNVDIFKKYRSGKKHHQSFKLPLNDLWKKTSVKSKTQFRREKDSDNRSINMFVPTPRNMKHIIFSGNDLFMITADRQLLKKEYSNDGKKRKGWRVLHMQIPYIDCHYSIGRNDKGQYVLLSCFKKEDKLHLLNIELNTSLEVVYSEHHTTRYKNFVYKEFSFYMVRHGFYFKIEMDGSFEKHEDKDNLIQKIVNDDIKKNTDNKKVIGEVEQSIKRIHTVAIKGGTLEINNHELFLNGQGDLKLKERISKLSMSGIKGVRMSEIRGQQITGNLFRFPNGNSIRVLKCGVLVLESTNKQPNIYLTLMIGKPLPAYIVGTFAGNETYFIEKKYLLRREKIFKIKGRKTDMLEPPFEFVESEILIGETEKYRYTKFGEINEFEKLSMRKFYNKYIYKFISDITRYGSGDQTT